MIDIDFVKYLMRDIEKNKNGCTVLSNREKAEEFFQIVKAKYPMAVMVEYDGSQYIAITPRGRILLGAKLKKWERKLEKQLRSVKRARSEVFLC